MKIGAEDKKKVIAATVLGVGVVVALVYALTYFFGGGPAPATPPPAQTTAAAPSPQPTTTATTTAASEHPAAKIPGNDAKLDPTLHPEWMAQAESLEYSGNGRNIFSQFSAPPKIEEVKAPVRPSAEVAQVPQGPPPPPPIDLKFFGYEAHKDGTRKAFLLHGDDVFIASEGDVVDHRYKVLKIAPMSVQVEDLPYQNAQPIALTQN